MKPGPTRKEGLILIDRITPGGYFECRREPPAGEKEMASVPAPFRRDPVARKRLGINHLAI